MLECVGHLDEVGESLADGEFVASRDVDLTQRIKHCLEDANGLDFSLNESINLRKLQHRALGGGTKYGARRCEHVDELLLQAGICNNIARLIVSVEVDQRIEDTQPQTSASTLKKARK
jgi:hypothetical protein